MPDLLVVGCGQVPYEPARRAQGRLAQARHRGAIPDVLLLLEHPPVYTRGRRADDAELPMGADWYRAQGIEVTDTDRGGRVTYHGPGQLVAYPIVALDPLGGDGTAGDAEAARMDVPGYVARMEQAIVATLADCKVGAQVIDGLTGVWTAGEPPPGGVARKIASIGIHVSRGITTHGLAVNVNNDLQPFEWIVPCGIEAVRMTSVSRELGSEQALDRVAAALTARFAEVYEREPVEIGVSELAARVDGVEALAAGAPAPVR